MFEEDDIEGDSELSVNRFSRNGGVVSVGEVIQLKPATGVEVDTPY